MAKKRVLSTLKPASPNMTPMFLTTSFLCFVMSLPPINTLPFVGVRIPDIILIVVLFPAPLGPMNPTISPAPMSKDRSLTAWIVSY